MHGFAFIKSVGYQRLLFSRLDALHRALTPPLSHPMEEGAPHDLAAPMRRGALPRRREVRALQRRFFFRG